MSGLFVQSREAFRESVEKTFIQNSEIIVVLPFQKKLCTQLIRDDTLQKFRQA